MVFEGSRLRDILLREGHPDVMLRNFFNFEIRTVNAIKAADLAIKDWQGTGHKKRIRFIRPLSMTVTVPTLEVPLPHFTRVSVDGFGATTPGLTPFRGGLMNPR